MPAHHALFALLIALWLAGCQMPPPITVSSPTATDTATLIPPTEAAATATRTVTPTETASPVPNPSRVILVSVPGIGREAGLSLLSGVAHETVALRSVDPPTTVAAHASLATGLLPAQTGIVGERVHRPEDSFYWYTSAFELPTTAMPIWKAASEQGLTTAALFWPGATSELSDQLADYTVAYGARDAYSNQHQLQLKSASAWADAPASFSPLLEAQFTIKGDKATIATVNILAIDTSDDSTPNLDTFILSKDRDVSFDDVSLHAGEWASWILDATSGQGADFLITQSDGASLTLFQSRVYHMLAYPEGLQIEVIATFGFFAPEPDHYALEQGWITEAHYLDMVRRQSDWMMGVTLWVDQMLHPDLLLTVQYPVDQAGHQFLLTDARQAGYSAERAAEYADYMQQATTQLDRALSQLAETKSGEIASGNTALFIVSPIALAPIHTQVNLNIALAQAGFLRLGSGGFVVVQSSKAIAFSSGGAAHIYLNIVSRDANGIVPVDQYDQLQSEVVDLLKAIVDPQTGEPIFARVLAHDKLSSIGLDGQYAGDIFVQANSGYFLSDERDTADIFQPVTFYGQQGYNSTLNEMHGALMVVSPFVPSVHGPILSLVDIAPTIADLLDITLPSTDGQSIFRQP